jgi:formyltetrahydrofolate-dependent phosphoribosylglycinamide formyltransferase
MPTRTEPDPRPARLGVLLSGGGTTMVNLAERIADSSLDASIAQVIASNDHCKGIDRAQQLGLPCTVVRRKDYSAQGDRATAAFSEDIFKLLREAEVDVVCLAGFLSLLVIPDDFVGRVLNIHPSLLPKFGGKGMHGRHVHEAVLAAGETTTGCTVHLADNTYDTGPVVLQRSCDVLPGDTPEALAARVFELEKQAYPEAITRVARGLRRSSR